MEKKCPLSIKTMLLGIGIILLGVIFAVSKSNYFAVVDIALGLFGLIILMSGFFTKD